MLEIIVDFLMIDGSQSEILYIPAAIHLCFVLAGIIIFLRKTQILLWSMQFFGSLWVASNLPYQAIAIFVLSLGCWMLSGVIIYFVYLTYKNKKMPQITHPDWK